MIVGQISVIAGKNHVSWFNSSLLLTYLKIDFLPCNDRPLPYDLAIPGIVVAAHPVIVIIVYR